MLPFTLHVVHRWGSGDCFLKLLGAALWCIHEERGVAQQSQQTSETEPRAERAEPRVRGSECHLGQRAGGPRAPHGKAGGWDGAAEQQE